jgi:hypothetical protein
VGGDAHDVRLSQLKGYLGEFFTKPDLSPAVWGAAMDSLGSADKFAFGFTFCSEQSMRQFALAVLLSGGKRFSWYSATSYGVVQNNLDGSVLLTDYCDYDIVFIKHMRGTMVNKVLGQSINQVVIQRGSKKTFFLDVGGYVVGDLIFPVTAVGSVLSSRSASALERL